MPRADMIACDSQGAQRQPLASVPTTPHESAKGPGRFSLATTPMPTDRPGPFLNS